jgi:hypothetical protein
LVAQDALVGARMNVLDAQAVLVVLAPAQMAVQGLVRVAVQEVVKKAVLVFVQVVVRTSALAAA